MMTSKHILPQTQTNTHKHTYTPFLTRILALSFLPACFGGGERERREQEGRLEEEEQGGEEKAFDDGFGLEEEGVGGVGGGKELRKLKKVVRSTLAQRFRGRFCVDVGAASEYMSQVLFFDIIFLVVRWRSVLGVAFVWM